MTISKIILVATLTSATLLSACASSDDGSAEVRNGPQAVHPSPSALAASGLSY